MKNLRRGILVIPFVLLALTMAVTAQENSATIVGSSVVLPIIQALGADISDVNITTTATGTTDGFTQFCAGQADAIAASRGISDTEDAACAAGRVTYQEFLVGQDMLVFVTNPADTFTNACLTLSTINSLLKPSASTTIVNWNAINPEYPDLALTAYVPLANTLDAQLLDNLVDGNGVRSDAQTLPAADILSAVASTPGAIGVVPYAAFVTNTASVSLLALDAQDENGCIVPSPENGEAGIYTVSQPFYLYVKAPATALNALIGKLADPTNSPVIASVGFTEPSLTSYARNQQIIAENIIGREFTKVVETYTVPAVVEGEVVIGGAPGLSTWVKTAADSFAQTQANLVVSRKFDGEPSGLRRFCNGELDAVAITTPFSAETITNCDANSITTTEIPLGTKAVVLVANASDTFATCLTRETLQTIFAVAETPVTDWAATQLTTEALPLKVLVGAASDANTDILLSNGEAPIPPLRADAEINADPLFRAAAVANVPGMITFMGWNDYQSVLANNQERIQLVNIDAGAGCITPSLDTITDGTYPLSESATLVLNNKSLANIPVQVLLWTLFSDENYFVYQSLGYTGVDISGFADIRATLLDAFKAASVVAAAPEATSEAPMETTPEATVESTAEVTPDAAVEVTAEATLETTPEVTAEATMEITAEVTMEPTLAPTQRPTSVPTAESTPEVTPETTPSS